MTETNKHEKTEEQLKMVQLLKILINREKNTRIRISIPTNEDNFKTINIIIIKEGEYKNFQNPKDMEKYQVFIPDNIFNQEENFKKVLGDILKLYLEAKANYITYKYARD